MKFLRLISFLFAFQVPFFVTAQEQDDAAAADAATAAAEADAAPEIAAAEIVCCRG